MWLGQRLPRIRLGAWRQLIGPGAWRYLIGPGSWRQLIGLALVAGGVMPAAFAQRAAVSTAGPGHIVCSASFCELGSAARPKERVRVIISGLPEKEIRRLRKCTGVSRPCIVTIGGIEQGDPMKLTATSIRWQDEAGQE